MSGSFTGSGSHGTIAYGGREHEACGKPNRDAERSILVDAVSRMLCGSPELTY